MSAPGIVPPADRPRDVATPSAPPPRLPFVPLERGIEGGGFQAFLIGVGVAATGTVIWALWCASQ